MANIDFQKELESINNDIDVMESQGLPQITWSYFGDHKDYQKFVAMVIDNIMRRGYTCETDFDDGEIWITIKRKA